MALQVAIEPKLITWAIKRSRVDSAVEMLVPLTIFQSELRHESLDDTLRRLARRFKVSPLVILRRMLDAGYLSHEEYTQAYDDELKRLLSIPSGPGGDFYKVQPGKLSSRFAKALVISTLEGQTLYRDALKMLGIKKVLTFKELSHKLGVMA